MFRKNKSKLIVFIFILVLISTSTIIKLIKFNNNNFEKTIVVEIPQNYLNGNNNNIENIKDEVKKGQIYKNNNAYNEKFNVTNMFPGDSETKYYCVNVSYKDTITLKYSANIKSDYKKIEEVFNLRIKLINTNEVLYDGTIKNIPKTLDYSTTSSESKTEDFCYEITAYLDTSVDNEYQDKETIIDFEWIVDEKNLEKEPNPITIDNIKIWITLAIVSTILLLIVLPILKNERKRLK